MPYILPLENRYLQEDLDAAYAEIASYADNIQIPYLANEIKFFIAYPNIVVSEIISKLSPTRYLYSVTPATESTPETPVFKTPTALEVKQLKLNIAYYFYEDCLKFLRSLTGRFEQVELTDLTNTYRQLMTSLKAFTKFKPYNNKLDTVDFKTIWQLRTLFLAPILEKTSVYTLFLTIHEEYMNGTLNFNLDVLLPQTSCVGFFEGAGFKNPFMHSITESAGLDDYKARMEFRTNEMSTVVNAVITSLNMGNKPNDPPLVDNTMQPYTLEELSKLIYLDHCLNEWIKFFNLELETYGET